MRSYFLSSLLAEAREETLSQLHDGANLPTNLALIPSEVPKKRKRPSGADVSNGFSLEELQQLVKKKEEEQEELKGLLTQKIAVTKASLPSYRRLGGLPVLLTVRSRCDEYEPDTVLVDVLEARLRAAEGGKVDA